MLENPYQYYYILIESCVLYLSFCAFQRNFMSRFSKPMVSGDKKILYLVVWNNFNQYWTALQWTVEKLINEFIGEYN